MLKSPGCALEGLEPSGPWSLTPTRSGGLSFSFSKSMLKIRQVGMAPRRRIALPPFLSPFSKSKFEARQTRLEHLGRLEWGTPVEAQRSPENVICRSGGATATAVELTSEEPPELDIGEALLSLPAHGTGEDDKICVRMPGRPSPVSISGNNLNMTTNAGAMSPSSSPRLPSPPPFTEVQIGPKSPTIGASTISTEHELGGVNKSDMGATRRIRPGTKAADMASGPPLVPLSEVSYTSRDNFKLIPALCKLLSITPNVLILTSSTLLSNFKNISKLSTTRTPNPPAPRTKSQ